MKTYWKLLTSLMGVSGYETIIHGDRAKKVFGISS
jgi:hypothetical protein